MWPASKRAAYLGIKTPNGMRFHSVFGVFQQTVQEGHGEHAEMRIEFPVRVFQRRVTHMGAGEELNPPCSLDRTCAFYQLPQV